MLPLKQKDEELDNLDTFFEKYKNDLSEDVDMESSDKNP